MTLDSDQVKHFSKPLYQSRHWMRLIGGMLIISGIAVTVTGIGVLVAWLPIWLGVILMKTAKTSNAAHVNGDQPMLELTLHRLRTAFTIMGVSLVLILSGSALFVYLS